MKPIVCLLLVSVYAAQGTFWHGDGMDDEFNPSRMQENIREDIARVNQKIQNDIKAQQQNADAMRTRIEKDAKSGGTYSSSSSSSSSSSTNNESVSSRSGTDANGNPFSVKIVDKTVNNKLCRTKTVRYPATGKTKVYKYTQDLSDPDSDLILVDTKETVE